MSIGTFTILKLSTYYVKYSKFFSNVRKRKQEICDLIIYDKYHYEIVYLKPYIGIMSQLYTEMDRSVLQGAAQPFFQERHPILRPRSFNRHGSKY